MRVGYAIKDQQKRWLVATGQLGQQVVFRPFTAFRHGRHNTLVDAGHAFIQLPAVHYFPAHTQAIQSIGHRFYALVLPSGLDPYLLKPFRLPLQHRIHGVPAKYIFLRH